MLIIAAFSHYE